MNNDTVSQQKYGKLHVFVGRKSPDSKPRQNSSELGFVDVLN
jgi:hypothetical protein